MDDVIESTKGRFSLCPFCDYPIPTIYLDARIKDIEAVAIANFAARIETYIHERLARIPGVDCGPGEESRNDTRREVLEDILLTLHKEYENATHP